ncbi:ATP synthase F1 subunit gamma [Candidatus Saccharibacteria bacterium 32-49-12]|nr:MAG: ATP synthase F1 subunit gamma [Candidatus Saccharibacteria bacterium 32-49-12]
MASTRQLKSRIRSVSNTKQITRAMQMVAASKMRRAQESTKASAPYAAAGNDLLMRLAAHGATNDHPLFVRRTIRKRLIIFVAADKGLAGAYNANLFKRYLELLKRDEERGVTNVTLTIGRKASQFATRLKGVEVIGSYDDLPDFPAGVAFKTILSTVIEMYSSKQVDAVTMVYTNFVSSMTQLARSERLLPAGTTLAPDFTEVAPDSPEQDVKYEPSVEEVLDGVVSRMIGARVFQALLDARASEHSMRMIAMKNATDNAGDLVDDLKLAMNKARQGAITQEISEISSGVEAMAQ